MRGVDRNLFADHAFDRAQQAAFFCAYERVGDTLGTGARCTADAMDIGFRLLGKIGYDMRDAVHIDTARSDVGRHQHAHAPARTPPRLVGRCLVAVNGFGANVGVIQLAHDLVRAGGPRGTMTFSISGRRQADQQADFIGLVDKEYFLVDLIDGRSGEMVTWTGFDHGIAERRTSGESVAEKLRVPLFGQFGENTAMSEEAHVQHDLPRQHKLSTASSVGGPCSEGPANAGRGYDEHGAATSALTWGYWLTPPKTTANGMPRNLP